MVALLLTVAFASVSFLLSGVVIRYAEAREKGAPTTAGLAVFMGAVLVLIEAGMTHQGLTWLDARHDLAPEWVLIVASFGLSAFNVFSLYTFAREIPMAKADRATDRSADVLVFGPNMTERQTLREIAEKMRANGAL